MTDLEASERVRARWTHPPIDLDDVEERIAVRLADRPELEARVVRALASCRVFVRRRGRAPVAWCSRYVDGAIAWLLRRLDGLEHAAAERARRRAEREEFVPA